VGRAGVPTALVGPPAFFGFIVPPEKAVQESRPTLSLMKPIALFLLPAGWIIVLAAVALMGSAAPRAAFALAGAAVQILGLCLLVRAHMPLHGDGQ